ncbi:MAG TPA: DUF1800 domain-containing protein [Steroidobacteraceae bacterium]|jgi:uncharacterized protein (DUF1800 family)
MEAEIAVLRFGLGARPGDIAAASDPRAWLMRQLQGPIRLASDQKLASSSEIFSGYLAAREERQQMRRSAAAGDAQSAFNPVKEAYQPHYRAQVLARAQSAAATDTPFAERLVHFWSNHFAISSDKGVVYGLAGTLENEAIRPNVNGRFYDLLLAVEQHPAMIQFLDNQASAGADSLAATYIKRPFFDLGDKPARQLGINENLAREILELHTLGVSGGYSQKDVTTFAQVITGWSVGGGKGRFAGGEPGKFYFRDGLHEPGAKTLLGKTYYESGVRQGEAVLYDLSHHPSTARFLATKLARHFIADDPPPAVVERLAKAYLKSGGDLPTLYKTLIDSKEAWNERQVKYKTPEDLVFSSFRALNISPAQPEEVVKSFELLGQRQYTPGSPAGWPDSAKSWDGSDALMHRVLFASRLAARYERGADPLDVASSSLGRYASGDTITAVRRAASPAQGLALLLMSPEFQRR